MNTEVTKLFSREEIQSLNKKLSGLVFNSATKGKCKYTRFELYPVNNKSTIVNPLISVFDIFVSEETFNKAINHFINESQTKRDYTLFEYNNMKLIKKMDGKTDCECYLDEEIMKSDQNLPILINRQKRDVADFSCRDDLSTSEITETIIKVCELAPIFISFIFDKQLQKYYYKLWFDIADDIDDVIDNFTI